MRTLGAFCFLLIVSCNVAQAERERAQEDVVIVYDYTTGAHLMTVVNGNAHDPAFNPPHSMQFTIAKEIYNRMLFTDFQRYAESRIPEPVHTSDGQ